MAIRQLFSFSKALVGALSVAAILPLAFSATAALAQTQSVAPSKPLSNSEKLLRGSSGAKRGAPGRRLGGGSRSNCAFGDPQARASMAMIAPADNVTVTTSAQPSLMLWVNQASQDRDLELVLRDAADELVYRKMLRLSDAAGVVTLEMSEWDDAPRLAQGEDYYLYLSLICDASDRSKDIVVEGVVSAVDYDSWLNLEPAAGQPSLASDALMPMAQAEHYAEIGLWHDAMVQFNHLRQRGETEAIRQAAQRQWLSLLEADDDLAEIAQATEPVASAVAIAKVGEASSFE